MAYTAMVLTDPVSGYSVQIQPVDGVSAMSLDVQPTVRAVTEDRVGSAGAQDTTLLLSAAAVTLTLRLYPTGGGAGPEVFLDALGPLLNPASRPYLIVTNSQWAQQRQMTVRFDSRVAPVSDPTFTDAVISWKAPNGVWEASALTNLTVPVSLPSATGIDFKAQGANFTISSATNASPCVFTATGSNYTAGTQVIITGGSLPTGFTSGQAYFILAPTANTFQLASSLGGTALASTSTGSGTVFDRGGIHFTSAAGLDMPATTAPGEFQVNNPGTAASPWTASLYGPCTGPKLANDATGFTLEFTDDVVLAPGSFIALDSNARTALLNNNPNSPVLGSLNFGTSDWWQIQPGINTFRYYPTTGSSAAVALISYRAAFMT